MLARKLRRAASAAPDKKFLAAVNTVYPYVTIYKQDGDTFTKLVDPAVLPSDTGNGVAFYPRAFEGPI